MKSEMLLLRNPEAASTIHRDIHTQNRINSFFYVALVPKLQPRWRQLQGKGEITFKYTYQMAGTNWAWQGQEVEKHNLQQEQAALALQFMDAAARGTSFPMEAAEAACDVPELAIHWTWPVPFPDDVTVMGRMTDTGDSGGEPLCVNCECPMLPLVGVFCTCVSTHSGFSGPCKEDAQRKGCNMGPPQCKSGRIGFGGGGVIIV